MVVYINDKATDLADNLTLRGWLEGEGLAERKGLAVAVNGAVVPRGEWENHVLKAQDKIILIGVFYGG